MLCKFAGKAVSKQVGLGYGNTICYCGAGNADVTAGGSARGPGQRAWNWQCTVSADDDDGAIDLCYAQGISSSRKIERASYRDLAVRYLTGHTHPDHDTMATFGRPNRRLFEQRFVQVLEMNSEVGVLQVGTVSLDGAKVGANVSKYKIVSYERCEELLGHFQQEVEQLVKEAEQGDRLPQQLRGPKQLKSKLARAEAVL